MNALQQSIDQVYTAFADVPKTLSIYSLALSRNCNYGELKMCIFSQPVISVNNNTQIFARVAEHDTQFLVYQMNYESRETNAMILPIPIRHPVRADSLRFIDLRHNSEFFDDLSNGFPYQAPSFNLSCSAPFNARSSRHLDVFNVGNYIASFVPRLADFSRLDERFALPATTWAKIPQYAEFGFAVFQLAAGSLRPHPMAFEFEMTAESIHFPTLHIHDGKIHHTEDFDHVLYMQHAGFDSQVYAYRNSDVPDSSTGLIRSKYAAGRFCDIGRCAGVVDGALLVHRKIIRGKYPNQDTEIATFGDPTKPTLNLRPLYSYAPWMWCGAAITWFFARRAKIKRMKSGGDSGDVPPNDHDRIAR